MFDSICVKGDKLVLAIDTTAGASSVEMKKLAIRFTIDSIMACACGLECNTLQGKNEDILIISEKIFGSRGLGQLYIFFIFAFPETAKILKMKQFGDEIENYFKSVIENTIQYRELNAIDDGEQSHDFLEMLVQLMTKGKIDGEVSSELSKLQFEDIVAQVFIIFFAGLKIQNYFSWSNVHLLVFVI
jgi:cytochrome P450